MDLHAASWTCVRDTSRAKFCAKICPTWPWMAWLRSAHTVWRIGMPTARVMHAFANRKSRGVGRTSWGYPSHLHRDGGQWQGSVEDVRRPPPTCCALVVSEVNARTGSLSTTAARQVFARRLQHGAVLREVGREADHRRTHPPTAGMVQPGGSTERVLRTGACRPNGITMHTVVPA